MTRHRGLTRIGFVTQPRPAPGLDQSLELPRGASDDLSAQEAVRELIEETNIEAATPLRRLGVIHPDTGLLSTQVVVWSVAVDYAHAQAAAGFVEEESRARTSWMTMGEVIGAISAGRITCGVTLAALMLARDTVVDVI